MKLIAESGSTRTEWALVEDNHLIQRVFTEGLNPFFQTRREISRSVRLGLPETFFKRKRSLNSCDFNRIIESTSSSHNISVCFNNNCSVFTIINRKTVFAIKRAI